MFGLYQERKGLKTVRRSHHTVLAQTPLSQHLFTNTLARVFDNDMGICAHLFYYFPIYGVYLPNIGMFRTVLTRLAVAGLLTVQCTCINVCESDHLQSVCIVLGLLGTEGASVTVQSPVGGMLPNRLSCRRHAVL